MKLIFICLVTFVSAEKSPLTHDSSIENEISSLGTFSNEPTELNQMLHKINGPNKTKLIFGHISGEISPNYHPESENLREVALDNMAKDDLSGFVMPPKSVLNVLDKREDLIANELRLAEMDDISSSVQPWSPWNISIVLNSMEENENKLYYELLSAYLKTSQKFLPSEESQIKRQMRPIDHENQIDPVESEHRYPRHPSELEHGKNEKLNILDSDEKPFGIPNEKYLHHSKSNEFHDSRRPNYNHISHVQPDPPSLIKVNRRELADPRNGYVPTEINQFKPKEFGGENAQLHNFQDFDQAHGSRPQHHMSHFQFHKEKLGNGQHSHPKEDKDYHISKPHTNFRSHSGPEKFSNFPRPLPKSQESEPKHTNHLHHLRHQNHNANLENGHNLDSQEPNEINRLRGHAQYLPEFLSGPQNSENRKHLSSQESSHKKQPTMSEELKKLLNWLPNSKESSSIHPLGFPNNNDIHHSQPDNKHNVHPDENKYSKHESKELQDFPRFVTGQPLHSNDHNLLSSEVNQLFYNSKSQNHQALPDDRPDKINPEPKHHLLSQEAREFKSSEPLLSNGHNLLSSEFNQLFRNSKSQNYQAMSDERPDKESSERKHHLPQQEAREFKPSESREQYESQTKPKIF